MDKETRENQQKIRQQKAEADRHIWAKVPPEIKPEDEAGQARRASPRKRVYRKGV